MNFTRRYISFLVIFSLLFTNCSQGTKIIEKELEQPLNIILLIGDGMGLAQISAAMAIHGQLSLEMFQHLGLVKTASADDYITDSAAGATAYSCGVKTYNGALGLDKDSLSIENIVEMAEKHGLSTGLVATCSVTHATPAAFFTHCKNRELHQEIANSFYGKGIDFIAAGGKPYFDLKQLEIDKYQIYTGSEKKSFDAHQKQFWFFNDSVHPPKAEERGEWLKIACQSAIQHLSQNKKGFFLMVEGSQIDWGGHDNDIDYVVQELMDFDLAVKAALDFAKLNGNTLVLVTADHETGGLTLDGGDLKKKTIDTHFSSTHHSGTMVPIYSYGPGADLFTGTIDNTDVFENIRKLYNF